MLFRSKVNEGSFRADLFYRINVFPINVPTLAERVDDIPLLLEHLLNSLKNKNDFPKFSDEAVTALKRHLWPGNIRELKNVIERAHILFSGEEVTDDWLFLVNAGITIATINNYRLIVKYD